MSTPDDHPAPDPFDACFQSMPAQAPADLFDRVRQAASKSPPADEAAEGLEEWLEDALVAWPASPSNAFTTATLARIRAEGRASKLVFFRLAPSLAAGLAACIVLVWGLPEGMNSGTPRPVTAQTRVAPTAVPIDPAVAEILLLAEGLEQPTRWLLDESHLTLLASAAE